MVDEWNGLSSQVVSVKTIENFKRRLDRHMDTHTHTHTHTHVRMYNKCEHIHAYKDTCQLILDYCGWSVYIAMKQ